MVIAALSKWSRCRRYLQTEPAICLLSYLRVSWRASRAEDNRNDVSSDRAVFLFAHLAERFLANEKPSSICHQHVAGDVYTISCIAARTVSHFFCLDERVV